MATIFIFSMLAMYAIGVYVGVHTKEFANE